MSKLETNTIDTVSGTANLTIGGANNTGTTTIKTNDTAAITIDSSQNVGIGTTSPLSILDIGVETSKTRRFLVNYDDSVVSVKSSNQNSNPESLRIVADTFRVSTGTTGSGTERMRVDNSGNVVIGSTTAVEKLTLYGKTWLDTRVSIGYNANSNSGSYLLGVANYGAVNNGAKLNYRICTTGNSGGHVIRIKYRNRSGDSEGGETNGAYCNGTSWVNASDSSMKTNVTDLSYGLSTIADLQPRAFDWTDSGESDIGFIAQELDDHIPEIVSGEDGSKGVNYGALTAVLVKALQEAKTKIETVETKRADLEARVTALENA